MRLFIAIDLSNECKNHIAHSMRELRPLWEKKGSIVPNENFHITLSFLGERDESEVNMIEDAMKEIAASPFSIFLTGELGHFSRSGRNGNTYFLRLEKSSALESLQWNLVEALERRGFRLEKGRYKPHITIARNSFLRDTESSFSPFKEHVDSICLMKSERVNGKMVYTPVFKRSLNDPV